LFFMSQSRKGLASYLLQEGREDRMTNNAPGCLLFRPKAGTEKIFYVFKEVHMNHVFGNPAHMPSRNGAHAGTLPWAGILAVMITLGLLLSGCPQPNDVGTTAYTVSGTITTDDPGGAASGAHVQLKQGGANIGNPVSTGANGTYTITGVQAGGGYTIEVSLTGYTTGTSPSFDVTGNVTGKDLMLVKITGPVYTVGGTITTNKPGGAASGAHVQLKQSGANAGNAVSTGANGAYTITGVPAGTGYTIEVSLSGYITGTTPSFEVTTGNVTGKNLTLVKIPDAGDKATYTGDGISFKMAYVPGGVTFPTGTGDTGTATVVGAYEIGETEVTYELWHKVRNWAETKADPYTFYNNPGREGSEPSSENTVPGANKQNPVTMVSWFDAAVWLNALTEWVNAKTGSSLTPVYYYDSGYTTVAKNSNYDSNFVKESGHTYASAYEKPGATGFRLPGSNEWELAARWRNNSTNSVSGYTNPYFTIGASASGAMENYFNTSATGSVAWYYSNSSYKTHAVKGKVDNWLGLYDMSGNVEEWCNDWYPGYEGSNRIIRGGSWHYGADPLRVGDVYNTNPGLRHDGIGFRPARTAQ
jgi:formylglycine-generating enzyme required for sulfatase activity